MSDAKTVRFNPDYQDRSMRIHDEGVWVLYSYAEEMQKRIERLEAALTNVRSDLCWLMDRHDLPMMLNDTLVGVCKALEREK